MDPSWDRFRKPKENNGNQPFSCPLPQVISSKSHRTGTLGTLGTARIFAQHFSVSGVLSKTHAGVSMFQVSFNKILVYINIYIYISDYVHNIDT